MTTVPTDFNTKGFHQYLFELGVTMLPKTSEWMVFRWQRDGHHGIVYQNKKGRIKLVGDAVDLWAAFGTGGAPEPRRAKPGKPLYQIFTDASHFPEIRLGTWAAVLVMPDGETHEATGTLRGEIANSGSAEARAMANALHRFCVDRLVQPKSRVIMVCDNINAVEGVNNARRRTGIEPEPFQVINRLRNAMRLHVVAEWIKGHQTEAAADEDARIRHNRRCDKLCRQHGRRVKAEGGVTNPA